MLFVNSFLKLVTSSPKYCGLNDVHVVSTDDNSIYQRANYVQRFCCRVM